VTAAPTAAAARRAYLIVLALRWLPTGFLVPIFVLLMTTRGLSLAEVGVAGAAQGIVIMLLELPTGGLADAIGRRPVLILSSLAAMAASGSCSVADDVTTFALAGAVMGLYRALDSGPLEAWFVDAVLRADPERRLEHDLGGAGVVLGLSLAVGSVAGGALGAVVAGQGDAAATSPLTAIVAAALVVELIHLAAVMLLVRESRPARGLRAAVRPQAPRRPWSGRRSASYGATGDWSRCSASRSCGASG
jgi:MFS family permease